jgi:hypothetical protein
MNIKNKLLLCLLPLFSCGCASLTKSQLTEVNTFGELSKNFSAYPSKFILSFNTIMEKEALFRANSRLDGAVHFNGIDSAYQRRTINDHLTDKADLTFKIIDKYAQSLVLLTSAKHSQQLDTAAQAFGTNMDALIGQYNKIDPADRLPTGIGGAVSALLTFGGEQYIRCRQADSVKVFVRKGDPLITKLTANILQQIGVGVTDKDGNNSKFTDLIVQLRADLKTDYVAFLGKRIITINSKANTAGRDSSSYINYRYATLDDDRECMQLLFDLDNLEGMLKATVTATQGLAKAHSQLLKDLDTKKNLKEFASDLQDYGESIKTLKTAIQKIQ